MSTPQISGSLLTRASRSDWSYAYDVSADPIALADGTLTITEHAGDRVGRTISSAYSLQEQAASGCRCFLLVLEDRTGDEDTAADRAAEARVGEMYECRVGTPRASCTCPCFAAGGRTCKHLIALDGLMASGDLPSPFEPGHDRPTAEDRYDALRTTLDAMPEAPEWADACAAVDPPGLS